MRSLKKARKPISTFDRSKDNSEATKTWPQESAKKLHAEEKYVTQLAVQIGRHSVRDKSCALFWWEKKNHKDTFVEGEGCISEIRHHLTEADPHSQSRSE